MKALGMQCVGCVRQQVARASLCLHRPSVNVIPVAHHWRDDRPIDQYALRHKANRPPVFKMALNGLKKLPNECLKWTSEVRDKFVTMPVFHVYHGDYKVLYKFSDQEAIDSWHVITDRKMNEGKSQAEFVLGQRKTGIFRGFVDTTVPKDGIIKNAGYCNIRSPTTMKSFQRVAPQDWSLFSHLVFRVRGDGRPYQIQLSMHRYYDETKHDQYIYTLFTRGGPYWQVAHIPFSKFFLTAKGRIQNDQERPQLHQIQNIGLTIGDGVMGPFQLEIDYIALIKDERNIEQCVYEMYKLQGGAVY